MGGRWSDLSKRVLSALVLLPLALLCVWAGGLPFLLLVVAGCVLGAREWVTLCGYLSPDPPVFWMPAVIAAAAICAGFGQAGVGLLLVVAGMVAALFPRRHGRARPHTHQDKVPARSKSPPSSYSGSPPSSYSGSPPSSYSGLTRVSLAARQPAPFDPEREHKDLRVKPEDDGEGEVFAPARPDAYAARPGHDGARADFAFGFPYLGLAAVALPWLRAGPDGGLPNTLFVLAIVWASDIGAYLIGRLAGGPKLAPWLSPGKTWSGAVGGLAGAVLAGFGVAACLSSGFSPSHVACVAIGLGTISQAGDLLESALKRHFGVKDSGRIIPGHGGLLDRLDALLAVAPAAALLALSVGRGVVLWR